MYPYPTIEQSNFMWLEIKYPVHHEDDFTLFDITYKANQNYSL